MARAAAWELRKERAFPAPIQAKLDALGENFEKTTTGFIDFLLLNEKGFPLVVLEAKAEDKNPLVGLTASADGPRGRVERPL